MRGEANHIFFETAVEIFGLVSLAARQLWRRADILVRSDTRTDWSLLEALMNSNALVSSRLAADKNVRAPVCFAANWQVKKTVVAICGRGD